MALRSVINGLHNLSLRGCTLKPCCWTGIAITESPLSSIWTRVEENIQSIFGFDGYDIKSISFEIDVNTCRLPVEHRRYMHSSSTLMRNLDSRAVPPYKYPSSKNGRWEPRKKMSELYEYTTRPLPFPKTGGRGPNGRIWNHKRGGGHKRRYRMIDWVRGGATEGEPHLEKVHSIRYDPNRSARIALVASGDHKRYIIATQNMKPGDVIKSSRVVSKTAVRANEGDAYPLGSLPIGTLINCLELFPGAGSLFVRAAGVQAQLLRKTDNQCIVRLPSKREISVRGECVATVGRVSNIDHNKRVIGKAGRNRWLGIRPRSGRWHRKTGRFGRKIKPPKAVKLYTTSRAPRKEPKPFTIHGIPKMWGNNRSLI